MTIPDGLRRSYGELSVWAAVLALGGALYVVGVPESPPGFYVDESSIAYNAHLVARTGRDEHGVAWPLFFRAFGEYKNPVYIYFLAALYKLTGPSILVARLLSAAMGVAGALLLGLLASRVSKRTWVGPLVMFGALLTPWFYGLSRVVVEVAFYPTVVALFLLCVRRASDGEKWSSSDALAVTASLTLLTYTYSVGRLLAPLLALGLALFATRARLRGILLTWALYALTLVPLYVFYRRHPGALTERFSRVTYFEPDSSLAASALEFARHYVANFNVWRMLVKGSEDITPFASFGGEPPVLAATFLLALVGAWHILRDERRDAWWRYIFYGLAASVVPASLTVPDFHMLRLSPLPVFITVLTVPALERLLSRGERRGLRRTALTVLAALILAQGAFSAWRYHVVAHTPARLELFDAAFPQVILPAALAVNTRPIYITDPLTPSYIQAYWHGALRGVHASEFVILPPDESPPMGAVVITTEENCPRCPVLARSGPYTVYIPDSPPRARAPLPEGGFRAEIHAPDPPTRARAGERLSVRAIVQNTSDAVWLARERNAGKFQVHLGARWLDVSGRALAGGGRGPLLEDLSPGAQTEFKLFIEAPKDAGDYVLELDMVQEGVSWFGMKGSKTTRLSVRVE